MASEIQSGKRWVACTPSDTENFAEVPRAIYVGGAGDIVMVDETGNDETFAGAVAGQMYSLSPIRINSTNTTATNIKLIY